MVQIRRYIIAIILIILIIFGVAPIILSALPFDTTNENYSIYSDRENGLSIWRNEIESIVNDNGEQKYSTTNLISNLNALNRLNRSGVLVVVGPSASYDQSEFISLLLFLLKGGTLIVADDFGTGNQILAPIFDAIAYYDSFRIMAQNSYNQTLPSIASILSSSVNESESSVNTQDEVIDAAFGGGSASNLLTSYQGSIFNFIGNVLKRFEFNGSVLMDVQSNAGNPNRPTIVDVNSVDNEYSFTQNVRKVQLELSTVISLQLNASLEVDRLDYGNIISNQTNNDSLNLVWQPLTKLLFSSASSSTSNISTELDLFRYLDFLFPLYSSKHSWLESDLASAVSNTSTPDEGEWGNAEFSIALNLPIVPGGGKIIFIADPSIFINKWTANTTQNDNLLLARNLIEMAANNLNSSGIPIIFDFGHTYQSLLSPSLYSINLLKIIANTSMFPLLAPFVPLIVYGFGKKFIPKQRRLRSLLLTKRRSGRGFSQFDRKLAEMRHLGTYGQAVKSYFIKLRRGVRGHIKYKGSFELDVNEFVSFFSDASFNVRFSEKEIRNYIRRTIAISKKPKKPISRALAKRILLFLKDLNNYLT